MTGPLNGKPIRTEDYAAFLAKKSQLGSMGGFEPIWIPEKLFDFQKFLTSWSIRKGRSALIEDCGLGKTFQSLVWGENVVRHTNKPVLVLTPLAVAKQTIREGEKFGVECVQSRDGKFTGKRIVVTNYERLHYFRPDDFAGIVCDEAPSCIKAMDGKLREQVTEFLRTIQYRLLCGATAAPNDYIELGTGSEALGEMGQRDMISMFFRQETKKDYLGWGRTKYRMMGHAEVPFWKWVCSWARACRRPSDLGFSDEGFSLPPLHECEHVVQANSLPPGWLFEVPARDMQEERAERRRTINERCQKVAELVNHKRPSVMWCHLNPEGDLLQKMIPGSRQIKGDQGIEEREELYEAFSTGELTKLILKPIIGAWGLNWQHCNHTVTFGSHSFEQRYQLVRRFWRFGQKNPVTVDSVFSEGEQRVSANLKRKEAAADRMFTERVKYMNDAMRVEKSEYTNQEEIPAWLSSTRT